MDANIQRKALLEEAKNCDGCTFTPRPEVSPTAVGVLWCPPHQARADALQG